MAGNLKAKPATRRDAADTVRLKHAGDPAHINAGEARLLGKLMPEAAGPVITRGLLAEAGRRGDDRVTKLIPAEAALLKAHGGAGTRNPASGLLEFNAGDGQGTSEDDDGGISGSEGKDSFSGGPGQDTISDGGAGGNDPFGVNARTGRRGLGYGLDGKPYGGVIGLGLEQAPYDPTTMPSVESLLNTPSGYRAQGYEGINMMQYSPPDTWGRLLETYIYGPPPSYKARGQVPGNLSAPSVLGPGVVGKGVTSLVGGPMSAAMNLGMHFDQAMSPETRAASLAENQATGAKNSTGQDRDSVSGLSVADIVARTPGGQSGSATAAQMPAIPPGYTVNPAGQLIPLPRGKERPAWRDPVRNMLADFVLRGRQGAGW